MRSEEDIKKILADLEANFQKEWDAKPITRGDVIKTVNLIIETFDNVARDPINNIDQLNKLLGIDNNMVIDSDTGKININKNKLFALRLEQLHYCSDFQEENPLAFIKYFDNNCSYKTKPCFIYNGHSYVFSKNILKPNSHKKEILPYKYSYEEYQNSLYHINKVLNYINTRKNNDSDSKEITIAYFGNLNDSYKDNKYDLEKLAETGYFDNSGCKYRIKIVNFRPTKIADDYVIFNSNNNDIGNIYDLSFMQEMALKYDLLIIESMPCIQNIASEIDFTKTSPYQEVINSFRSYAIARSKGHFDSPGGDAEIFKQTNNIVSCLLRYISFQIYNTDNRYSTSSQLLFTLNKIRDNSHIYLTSSKEIKYVPNNAISYTNCKSQEIRFGDFNEKLKDCDISNYEFLRQKSDGKIFVNAFKFLLEYHVIFAKNLQEYFDINFIKEALNTYYVIDYNHFWDQNKIKYNVVCNDLVKNPNYQNELKQFFEFFIFDYSFFKLSYLKKYACNIESLTFLARACGEGMIGEWISDETITFCSKYVPNYSESQTVLASKIIFYIIGKQYYGEYECNIASFLSETLGIDGKANNKFIDELVAPMTRVLKKG